VFSQNSEILKCLYVTGREDLAMKFIARATNANLRVEFCVTLQNWLGSAVTNYPPYLALRLNAQNAIILEKEKVVFPTASNWRMPTKNISCKCSDCEGFKEFLKSPTQTVWNLKVVKKWEILIKRLLLKNGIILKNCELGTLLILQISRELHRLWFALKIEIVSK
jgi:hypothetical protein